MQKPDRLIYRLTYKAPDRPYEAPAVTKEIFADSVESDGLGGLVFVTHVEAGKNVQGDMTYVPRPALMVAKGHWVSVQEILNGSELEKQSGKISTIVN